MRRSVLTAALLVVVALPSSAAADVGDLVQGVGKPWVVIAEGKYPKRGHTRAKPWFVVARPCGDGTAAGAQYQLFLGKPTSSFKVGYPCQIVPANARHLFGWGASPGVKKSRQPRTIQYGGVEPSVEALKLVVKTRWLTAPLIALTPEQTAAAGFEPGVKFYVRDSPPERTFRRIPRFGVAVYSGGKLVDCFGRDCETGGGT